MVFDNHPYINLAEHQRERKLFEIFSRLSRFVDPVQGAKNAIARSLPIYTKPTKNSLGDPLCKPFKGLYPREHLKGPGIIATTHKAHEWLNFQQLSSNYIHWITDPRLPRKQRQHRKYSDIKVAFFGKTYFNLGQFLDHAGLIEIDRTKPMKGLVRALGKSLDILCQGGLLGITPIGRAEHTMDIADQKSGEAAIGWLAQKAQEKLGQNIPIYPIAAKEMKDHFIPVCGKTQFLKDKNYRVFSREIIELLETLANTKTTLQRYKEFRQKNIPNVEKRVQTLREQ